MEDSPRGGMGQCYLWLSSHSEGTTFYSKAEQHAGPSDGYFQNMILFDELKIDEKELDWKQYGQVLKICF